MTTREVSTIAEHKVSSTDADEIELLQSVSRRTLGSLPGWKASSAETCWQHLDLLDADVDVRSVSLH